MGAIAKFSAGSRSFSLRLDNTGAWVIEVYPSLLCNQMPEHVVVGSVKVNFLS